MSACNAEFDVTTCKQLEAAKSWTDNQIYIMQEVMCIIVFSQLNMWALLHKAGLPGHPKALLALLDTYQS
jgi:hypothetical protein